MVYVLSTHSELKISGQTPLTAIITYLETMQLTDSSLSDEDRTTAMKCEASARELLNSINNILEVSRSQERRQSMSWETIDLFDVADFVLSEVEPLLQRKHIKLERQFEPNAPLIRGDWEKIRHIIRNLLSNAIKYSDEGGSITVGIKPVEKQYPNKQAGVLIQVCDEGSGIEQSYLDSIFSRYFQAASTEQRTHDGTGLGLFVVKEFVELHNGSIDVESTLEKGSTFTVYLPVNTNEELSL